MNVLERYKELAAQDDALCRASRDPDRDSILDLMDPLWDMMSAEERNEARAHTVYLHSLWTPAELYAEAVDVIDTFPKPSANDVTPPEVRAEQLAYWVRKRDEALQRM